MPAERLRAAVASEDDRGRDRLLAVRGRIVHLDAVDAVNQVARFHSGTLGRAARQHVVHAQVKRRARVVDLSRLAHFVLHLAQQTDRASLLAEVEAVRAVGPFVPGNIMTYLLSPRTHSHRSVSGRSGPPRDRSGGGSPQLLPEGRLLQGCRHPRAQL